MKSKIIFILIFILWSRAQGMSIFDLGKVCLFSNISGIITLNGQVVSNAKLVRTVNLSKTITDGTTTNEVGYFELPVVFARTINKYLPQEFAVNQGIVVFYEGKKYRMWSAVKRKPEENVESRGKSLVVKCELNSQETMIKINSSPIFSLCRWEVEPDKRRTVF